MVVWHFVSCGWSSGGCAKKASQVLEDCRSGHFSRWLPGWCQHPRPSGCHQRADWDVHLCEPSVRADNDYTGDAPRRTSLSFFPLSQITMYTILGDKKKSEVAASVELEEEGRANDGWMFVPGVLRQMCTYI